MKKLIATLFVIIIGAVNILITTEDAEAAYEQAYKLSLKGPYGCEGGSSYTAGCYQAGNECSYYPPTCF